MMNDELEDVALRAVLKSASRRTSLKSVIN